MTDQMTSLTAGGSLPADARMRNSVLAINLLYAASCFVVITSLVAVILAYMRRAEANGTIWESHVTYAIRTFWLTLLLSTVGLLLSVVGIGLLILLFVAVWFIVRVVRAFLAWNDNSAIANPKRFF